MKKAQLEKMIMFKLKEATELYDSFHGYFELSILQDVIFQVMFGHKSYTWRHHYDRSIRKGWDTFEDNYTAEEQAAYQKIQTGMINAGIIALSKSGKMFKLVK